MRELGIGRDVVRRSEVPSYREKEAKTTYRRRRAVSALALIAFVSLASCTEAEPVPQEATAIEASDVQAELRELATSELLPAAWYILDTERAGAVYIRTQPGSAPMMLATSCEVLTSNELPEGWTGKCSELTENGERVTTTLTYDEAVDRLDG